MPPYSRRPRNWPVLLLLLHLPWLSNHLAICFLLVGYLGQVSTNFHCLLTKTFGLRADIKCRSGGLLGSTVHGCSKHWKLNITPGTLKTKKDIIHDIPTITAKGLKLRAQVEGLQLCDFTSTSLHMKIQQEITVSCGPRGLTTSPT